MQPAGRNCQGSAAGRGTTDLKAQRSWNRQLRNKARDASRI